VKKLSKDEIDYIRRDLREKGLVDDSLHDELVDHVCCELDLLLQKDIPFKKAYEQLLSEIGPSEIPAIQERTFQAKNYNTPMLLRNNFKIMFRNMKKNLNFTFINVGGLALGLLSFIAIAIYINHELSFDKQFSKSNSIYRITMSTNVGGATNHIPTSYPTFGPLLHEQYSDITDFVRIINYKYSRLTPTISFADKLFYEDRVIFADSSLFRVFNFSFAEGNAEKSLTKPESIVMTESMARKYFGYESALGKHIRFNNTADLEVTGIINDIPSNTHLQFDFVVPITGLSNSGIFRGTRVLESWNTDWFWTYVVIPDKNSVTALEQNIDKLTDEKIPDEKKEHQAKFFLQALGDVHLNSHFDYNTDITENGSKTNLYIFASVAILVLLISSINFINISIALATRRYKEIGISKVLGAVKSQLRQQFLMESMLTCITALVLAFICLKLVLPMFSSLLGTNLHVSLLSDFKLLAGIVSFTLVIGLLSGLYPAFFVSSFEPQRVLKGVWKPGSAAGTFRKILVGFQIAISISLVVGTVIIFQQLNFIQHKELGFDREHVIMLNVRGTAIPNVYYSLKNKLEGNAAISSVSSVSEPIGREVQFMSFKVEGREEDQFIKILNVTHDFAKTMGLEIVQGRDFSREVITDSISGFVINEAMAKTYGWKDPIGKSIRHAFPNAPEGKVIGVVKDFNFEPLHKQIDPLVMWFGRAYWYIAVKTKSSDVASTLAFLESTWKEFEPAKPFSFHFLDQAIQKAYDKEQRVRSIFLVFSILSIVTASLGLFGLISFIAEQRLMEIGIRKVFGASVRNIVALITKDYVALVLVAFILAAPLTYSVMNLWLQEFAYRVDWSPVAFVVGLLLILTIVVGTVCLKALSAAKANPVKTLRGE
jgi:putative ABC transport system permease protein